jgi:uncharacterized membrane protein YbhN (UPF0104 family)
VIRVFNLLMLVVGAVALVLVVGRLGTEGVRQAIVGTGAWFALIALIDLGGAMCDTQAIRHFMRPAGDASFWRVFVAQVSGMAINRLTPGRTLGEPVKITMLMQWVASDVAVPAIVRFNLFTMYVGIAAIVVGAPVTVLLLDLPSRVEVAVELGMAGLVVIGLVVGFLFRRGTFARWIGPPGKASAAGVAFVFGSRCFNWLGTIVVLHAAGISLTAPLVIAALSVGILVTWISQIVPLGLGVADGSNYVLYGLLGASPAAGLLFTMIDRLRTILIALCGLSVMGGVKLRRAMRSSRPDRREPEIPRATES